MKLTTLSLAFILAQASADLACKTDDDCSGDLKCAVQDDGYYAQCVDCTPDQFSVDCPYWSDALLEAAEETCGIDNCTKPDPPTAECATDDDCDGETNDCIVQADGLWAQCIDCGMNQTEFSSECVFWSQPIIDAAEARCEMSCAPPAQCEVDDDCDGDLECAVQENGLWAQCVPCDEETFDAQCAYWSDDIIDAAEVKCDQTCNRTKTA